MDYSLDDMKKYLEPDKELVRQGDVILADKEVTLDGVIDAFTLMAEGLGNIATKATQLKAEVPVERHGEVMEALEYALSEEVPV